MILVKYLGTGLGTWLLTGFCTCMIADKNGSFITVFITVFITGFISGLEHDLGQILEQV